MKVLMKFMFAVVVVGTVVEVVPSVGGRVWKMKEEGGVLAVYDKGPVPPSGPSTCTYIPGTGGTNCPPVKEIKPNYHPHLLLPFPYRSCTLSVANVTSGFISDRLTPPTPLSYDKYYNTLCARCRI
ncbi:hypothetical protein V8G54_028963 [Vigna mungo]|uniref:Uncharacterized protein n=1 Tax=Vigna mungo TaxID=3915 RepID=A0AAQ3MT05_VIGMU